MTVPAPSPTRFLPHGAQADHIVCCLGLVSDTHMPERCADLPAALFSALQGVDLLLHAGDVGELWVLDRLSALAPVLAVHGNDDTAEARRALPYQQVIALAGQRLLLCHSHYPDLVEELASRQDDAWAPKLDRRAALGQRAGARIVVFGHTHIPMALWCQGVLLVNPGAIASGSPTGRQRLRTVALLFVRDDGAPIVVHVDLSAPERAYTPRVDWGAGYVAALDAVNDSILSPALAADWPRLAPYAQALTPEQRRAVLLPLAYPCWNGEREAITHADLLAAVRAEPSLPATVRAGLEAILLQPGPTGS